MLSSGNSQTMKILSKLLPSLLLLLFASSYCDAKHLMGADIAWKCLGNDKYRVTTTVYRDCSLSALSNKRMTFQGNCSGITPSSQRMSSGKDITPVCSHQCTKCSSRFCTLQYGIQRHKIVAIIDVSSFKANGCCEVTISWTECCRSGTITTGAADYGLYVEGKINVCQSACNNSPVFSSAPISIICVGQDVIMNAGTFDKDFVNGRRDSLVHSLVDPLAWTTYKTSWNGQYTSQKPINYRGFPLDYPVDKFPYGFHLDSTTGQLMFRPMRLEQTVFAIKVEEYRNGRKIGEVMRDAQIIVIKCPNNNPPVLSGADCATPKVENFNIYVCAGNPICVDICASDQDKNDTIELTCKHSIPKATYSVSGTARKKVLNFCWKPKLSHVRPEPYLFSVKASDSACPIPRETERIYKIYVGDSTPFQISTNLKPIKARCGEFWLQAKTLDNIPNNQWKWYLNDTVLLHSSSGLKSKDSFKYEFDSNGIYNIKIESSRSGGCFEVFKRSINMTGLKPIQLPQLNDTSLCKEKRLNTRITATGGHGPFRYSWTTNDGVSSAQSDTINFLLPQPNPESTYIKRVNYTVTDSAGCIASNDFRILVKYHENLALMNDITLCGGDLDTLLPTVKPSSSLQGTWSGDGVNQGRFSSKNLARKLYKLEYFGENSKGCISDTALIAVYSLPIVSAGRDLHGCPNMRPLELNGKPSGGKWLGSYINRNLFTPPQNISDTFVFIYTYEDSMGCRNTDTTNLTVLPYKASIHAGPDTFLCGLGELFALAPEPTTGTWRGFNLETHKDTTYFNSSFAQVGKTYPLVFDGYDSIGCLNSDTMTISIKALPKVDAGLDLQHCFLGPKDLVQLRGKPPGGIWMGNAAANSSQKLRIDITHLGTSKYEYRITDTTGCSNTDAMSLTVRNRPNVDAGLDDTLCLSSSIRKPLIGKPLGGEWTGSNLSQSGGKYFAKLSTTTIYKNTFEYEFTDSFGCTGSDEIDIYVGKETNTDFIPSALSGNAPLKVDFANKSTNGNSWKWNFGNNKESTEFEPSFTYLGGGVFKVILLTIDETGYCHSSDTQSITVKGGVRVSTIPEGLIALYPSPASESFVVKNETGKDLGFTLYNETGQIVLERKVHASAWFDARELPKGHYFYKMTTVNGQFHQGNLIVE